MGRYDDIIHYNYVPKKNHKRMDLNDRAKIFLPFAALSGYEEIIAANSRILEKRRELMDEGKAEIDRCLMTLNDHIKENPLITITYFKEEKDSCDGLYVTVSGKAESLNLNERNMTINGECIYLDDIYEFKGEVFDNDESVKNL